MRRRRDAVETPEPAGPRPFIKWAGGKSWAVEEHIRPILPPRFGRYYEPFVGGAALFFALQPAQAVLSDANAELIDCYRAIRDDVDGVIHALYHHEAQYKLDGAAFYYRVRDGGFASVGAAGAAARMIFLNKTGFNGLYRVNSAGRFNVPHGRTASGKPPLICDAENLRACSRALQGADLHHTDALSSSPCSILSHILSGDFCYLDSPYDDTFTSYTAGGFGQAHQHRLSHEFRELAARGVYVLASNADTPTIRELYRGYRMIELNGAKGRRNTMSAKASSRGEKKAEILIVGWS